MNEKVLVNSPYEYASHHKQKNKFVSCYLGSVPTFVVDSSWPYNLYLSASSASGSAASSQDSSSTATPTAAPSDNKRKRTRNDTEVSSQVSCKKNIHVHARMCACIYTYIYKPWVHHLCNSIPQIHGYIKVFKEISRWPFHLILDGQNMHNCLLEIEGGVQV